MRESVYFIFIARQCLGTIILLCKTLPRRIRVLACSQLCPESVPSSDVEQQAPACNTKRCVQFSMQQRWCTFLRRLSQLPPPDTPDLFNLTAHSFYICLLCVWSDRPVTCPSSWLRVTRLSVFFLRKPVPFLSTDSSC